MEVRSTHFGPLRARFCGVSRTSSQEGLHALEPTTRSVKDQAVVSAQQFTTRPARSLAGIAAQVGSVTNLSDFSDTITAAWEVGAPGFVVAVAVFVAHEDATAVSKIFARHHVT